VKVRGVVDAEKQSEIDELQKKLDGLEGTEEKNVELLLDNDIKKTMLSKDCGVLADRVDDLFLLTKAEFKLTEDKKPMLTNHPGMEIKVFVVDKLKAKYPWAFQGTQAGGGGAGGAFDGTPRTGMSVDDKMAHPEEAMAAARAADGLPG